MNYIYSMLKTKICEVVDESWNFENEFVDIKETQEAIAISFHSKDWISREEWLAFLWCTFQTYARQDRF